MYYRGASAALLVYDITSAPSFNKVKDWVTELRSNLNAEDIIMVVVGNKLDKAEKHRQLKTEVGEEYAKSVGAGFTETSAKTKEGIEEVFMKIAAQLVKNYNGNREEKKGIVSPGTESPKEINDSCCDSS
eukprot:TRINITY_DN1030_c0_g1_i1.p1 TRINITY_DN1030_c0_g1~~TRINITY_DN1030_c0_g1_i1.p1  ORF type:complete len:130 (-),score=18.36 TRINITY_DN1030_c0_g1_i1:65-454(-)